MCTFFFSEARRIASQSSRQCIFRQDGIDEFTDHGMFAGSDQIQIFTFDLIHHSVHLSKAHNTGNYIASDHERRYTVSKSFVDHKISCVRDNCGMNSCDVAHQIIETITCYFSCTVQIQTIERFHDFCMIRNFKIRNHRLTETFDLYVLAVVFSNRNRRIDDVRDCHHDRFDLFFYFFFSCRQFIDSCTGSCNFFLHFFCFFFFTLCHQRTDLFADFVFICTQGFYFLFNISVFLIQSDDFIYHRDFLILEFFTNIFFYHIRIFPDKLDI